MRPFERPDGRAKTGSRKRRLVRLRTGPGCIRGPLWGRKGWVAVPRWTKVVVGVGSAKLSVGT